MRDYEVVYIFHPELESDDVDARLESLHDRLDGEVEAVEHWGQRELAYEIEDQRRGYYVVAQFRADPASLSDFEQAVELDEEVIRHLLVLSEGELPTPPSQRHEEEDEEAEEAETEEAETEEDETDEDEEDEDEEDEAEEEEDEEEEDGEDEDEDEDEEDEPRREDGDDGESEDEGEPGEDDEPDEDDRDATADDAADEADDDEER